MCSESLLGCLRSGPDDSLALNSNYGASLSMLAPGICINSTYIIDQSPSGYMVMSGTSMAAPHVAGSVKPSGSLALAGRMKWAVLLAPEDLNVYHALVMWARHHGLP